MGKTRPTYFEAQRWAFLRLKAAGAETDTARWLLLALSQLDQTHLLMAAREPIPTELWESYQAAVEQVLAGNPPQYVVGRTDFYGLSLKVSPAVLIPRVETTELVDWVLTDHQPDRLLKVLDVGTGSGAIALALKHERPAWQLTGVDLSAAALAVAKENGDHLGLAVDWLVSDLFSAVADQKFDIIVSNPPYIDHAEEAVMDASVLAHEPKLALFAAHHGLAIYEQLAASYQKVLTTSGRCYLEIGYHQGPAVKQIFQQATPTATVEVRQDLAGHDRMVRIIK